MIHWTQIVLAIFTLGVAYIAFVVLLDTLAKISKHRKHKKFNADLKAGHCQTPHEYISIYLPQINKETSVCKVCGFCGALDGYLPPKQVQLIALQREAHSEYEYWKETQIEEISLELGLGFNDTEILANRILAFRRDYQVALIEKRNER